MIKALTRNVAGKRLRCECLIYLRGEPVYAFRQTPCVHRADRHDLIHLNVAIALSVPFCQHQERVHCGHYAPFRNAIQQFPCVVVIRYLEDKLVKIARECNRFIVLTKNTYGDTVLKESQIATMEEFIDNIRILINTLGYKVLVPAPQPTEKTVYLYCKGNNGDAKGFISAEGLTVVKGSKVSDHMATSFETRARSYYLLRNRLIADGTIVDGEFQTDYEFSSPSAGSAVVLGRSSNGNVDWKNADGRSLKEL